MKVSYLADSVRDEMHLSYLKRAPTCRNYRECGSHVDEVLSRCDLESKDVHTYVASFLEEYASSADLSTLLKELFKSRHISLNQQAMIGVMYKERAAELVTQWAAEYRDRTLDLASISRLLDGLRQDARRSQYESERNKCQLAMRRIVLNISQLFCIKVQP